MRVRVRVRVTVRVRVRVRVRARVRVRVRVRVREASEGGHDLVRVGVRVRARVREASERSHDLCGERSLARRVPDLEDFAVLGQECRDPARRLGARVGRRAVGDRDGQVCVAQQRETEAVLLREGRVLGRAVVAAADDGDVLLSELREQPLERHPLRGSSTSRGARVEPEQHLLASKVREREGVAGVCCTRECRCLLSDGQSHGDRGQRDGACAWGVWVSGRVGRSSTWQAVAAARNCRARVAHQAKRSQRTQNLLSHRQQEAPAAVQRGAPHHAVQLQLTLGQMFTHNS